MNEQAYAELLKQNQELMEKLRYYETNAPLVGIRWYGDGSIRIGLDRPCNGLKELVLDGYGDKGVINRSDWIRIRKINEVTWGIIVRDDTVIDEMGVVGVKADPDKQSNVNAFTDKVALSILKKGQSAVRGVVNNFTHHFPCKHLRYVYNNSNIGDVGILSIIKQREKELLTRFNLKQLSIHDLRSMAELADIDFRGLTSNQLVDILLEVSLEQSDED